MTSGKKSDNSSCESSGFTAEGIYHFLEWLVTALASTLVFIVFIMQVYRIPTGSMADTLKGAHFRLRCEQCGYRYEYDFSPRQYGLGENVIPKRDLPILKECRCPSCGYAYRVWMRDKDPRYYRRVYKGDQIFVLKCVYQFWEPSRWDVVVFKNPLEPHINYIKRLIGRPGEKVEIIDGDIYINDRIVRKPPSVQDELWMPIYENDYQPARPEEERFNRRSWRQPFENLGSSRWDLGGFGRPYFLLAEDGTQVHRIQYNPQIGNDFRAVYAYDPPDFQANMPICSDLMLRSVPHLEPGGGVGYELGKYGRRYQGWLHGDGRLEIFQVDSGEQKRLLASGTADLKGAVQRQEFRFSNVDHQLILEYGRNRLEYDLGRGAEDAGTWSHIQPEAAILGYGKVQLAHIGLFRDIYYMNTDVSNPRNPILQGGAGNPIVLGEDEFFVCGDNSPYSLDSRWWNKPGRGNHGRTFAQGVVPRDYFVGKAFFVHWPGGDSVLPGFIRFVPYVEGMKIIYGGSRSWDKAESLTAEAEKKP